MVKSSFHLSVFYYHNKSTYKCFPSIACFRKVFGCGTKNLQNLKIGQSFKVLTEYLLNEISI